MCQIIYTMDCDILHQTFKSFSTATTSNLQHKKELTDANNNTGVTPVQPKRGEKYSLRPRSLRKEDDENSPNEKSILSVSNSKSLQSRPKSKAAPLSKYRRKTANARERSRMREINRAFEALRRAVPHMFVAQCPNTPISTTASEKLTKITTLRLAMRYISTLKAILQDPTSTLGSSSVVGVSFQCVESSDAESLDNSLCLSDRSVITSPELSETSLSPADCAYDFDNPLPEFLHTNFMDNVFPNVELEDANLGVDFNDLFFT